jgi:hypothetical protein
MQDSSLMKKAFIYFVILLVSGVWTANKYLQRFDKSSEEKDRFIERASNYNHAANIFLTKQAKQHHDEAFAASYRMWKLTPLSEFDLDSHYDEQTYYRTLGKLIAKAAKKEGQTDAYTALLDIGQWYGVPTKKKVDKKTNTRLKSTSTTNTPVQPEKKKEPLLKSSKLGEKRTIPSRRRRDY